MNQQDIFEFLRDNLRISLDDSPERDYGRYYQVVSIKLMLTNPATGQDEVLSSESFQIDLEK